MRTEIDRNDSEINLNESEIDLNNSEFNLNESEIDLNNSEFNLNESEIDPNEPGVDLNECEHFLKAKGEREPEIDHSVCEWSNYMVYQVFPSVEECTHFGSSLKAYH